MCALSEAKGMKKYMSKKVKYIKLDIDDIMEILLEHFQEQFENGEYAKGIFLGTPEEELRFIGVFGDQNNEELNNVNLKEIDKNMDYNGEHAFLRNNPDFFLE